MKRLKASIPILVIYILWGGVSLAVYWAGRRVPVPADIQGLVFVLTALLFVLFGFCLTTYYLLYGWRRLSEFPGMYAAWVLVSVALTFFLYFVGQHLEIGRSMIFIINTANLFVFANLIGALIVKPLKRPAELIILCVVLAFSDLFSVLSGPTRVIVKSVKAYYESGMQGPAPAGDFLLIKSPAFGTEVLQPVFGVSDWIIIVFLSAAAFKFGINDNLAGKGLSVMARERRMVFYLPVAGIGLLLAAAAAHLLNVFIPVLPIMAVVYISYLLIFHPSARQLKKTDWWLMGGFAGGMLCLLALGLVMTGQAG
ncbi:MAG: hypothetical protein U5L07_12335 [Desulfobacterales bacterium]|nr:hypothetical protein [Desulfobacterales bacterium]